MQGKQQYDESFINNLHMDVDFPQFLPLHFYTIERLIAQTLTTPFQSVK